MRRAGADLVAVESDDLGRRVIKALGDAALRVLFEGTGDPGQIAELVRAVEDGGSVIAFASATGQARPAAGRPFQPRNLAPGLLPPELAA
ncbi:MAG TPA: hypothetical protein VGL33_20425 [Streptosporangiaceae bacterium]